MGTEPISVKSKDIFSNTELSPGKGNPIWNYSKATHSLLKEYKLMKNVISIVR